MDPYEKIPATLKSLLRSRRVKYRDLARALGMSESGVKKLLTAKDLSTRRLMAILEVLEISFGDFCDLISEEPIREVSLTPKQEAALFKNFTCFQIYWLMVIEQLSLSEIKERFHLTQKVISRCLRLLDSIGMIRWVEGEKFQAPKTRLFRWVSKGPLLQHINRNWSQYVLRETLSLTESGQKPNEAFHSLNALFLSERTYREFRASLERLINEFSRRSERESLTHRRDHLKPYALLCAIAPKSFIEKI